MSWHRVALGEVFEIARGGSPRPISDYLTDDPDGLNWASISDATRSGKIIEATERRIRPEGLKKSRWVEPGDFLLSNSMSFGRPYIMGTTGCIHDGWLVLKPGKIKVDPDYLYHLLGSAPVFAQFAKRATGTTVKNLNTQIVSETEIPLPDFAEQQRIAAILDEADALRRLRRQSLSRLSELGQAIFLKMFGDPARNPHAFNMRPLREVASKFSDGPFGSNLKSSHYVDEGVRVIRLQNIGVNEFIDKDKAYITEEHFASLQKHECLPGDVIVGTLGDPNLRACIQPDWLPQALNKADCVQIRVDASVASNEYVCALLNLPSVERMAQNLVLGQTRARISMGRLRELRVPIAPKDKQDEYATIVARLREQGQYFERSLKESARLFSSLQHRAFRGEL